MPRYVRTPELIKALAKVAECDVLRCPPRTCLCRQQAADISKRYSVLDQFEPHIRPTDGRYHYFTREDNDRILAMREEGASVAEIATELNRTIRAIYRKIAQLKDHPEPLIGAIEMTKRQSELMKFIAAFWERYDYGPSFTEMSAALNLRSKSSIHRMIHSLSEQRYIVYNPRRARSVRVLPFPSGIVAEHVNV